MTSVQKATIGIIGAGPVARSLADVFTAAGHQVSISSRAPRSRTTGSPRVSIVSFAEAAKADVVMFAVLHTASRDIAHFVAEQLVGKLVIDVDNAWLPGHYERAGLSANLTEGQWLARLLPGARVARAFSHIDWGQFGNGLARPGYWGAGYAADDPVTDAEVAELVSSVGFVPISAGTLATSSAIDVDGSLWSRLLPAAETAQRIAAR